MMMMLNEDFTVESYAIVNIAHANSVQVWFPPTKSLITVLKQEGFDWQPSNAPDVGTFLRLKIIGRRRSPFLYDCRNVLSVSRPELSELQSAALFKSQKGPRNQLIVTNVPVVIGHYISETRSYVGFHYFFGRIAVPGLPGSGKLRLLGSYECELVMCSFGSSYNDSCRWEVKRLQVMTDTSSPIRTTIATCCGLFNEKRDFLFIPEGGVDTGDRVHVNEHDMVEGVPFDIFRGTKMLLVCEQTSTYQMGFAGTALYATAITNTRLPAVPRPFNVPTFDHTQQEFSLVQRIQQRAGGRTIRTVYPGNIIDLFNKNSKLCDEIWNSKKKN